MNELMAMAWGQNELGFFSPRSGVDYRELVGRFLASGLHVDAVDGQGHTALMHAFLSGRMDIVDGLVAHGARLDLLDHQGRDIPTLLRQYTNATYASRASETYRRTLAGSFEGRYIVPRVHALLFSHRFGELDALVRSGLRIDVIDQHLGQSLLMWAAKRGDVVAIRYLIGHGASLEFSTGEGTALCVASTPAAARALLAAEANREAVDIDGNTPLLRALTAGDEPLAMLLVEQGSPLRALNHQNESSLMCAAGAYDRQTSLRLMRMLVLRDPGIVHAHGGDVERLLRAAWRHDRATHQWLREAFERAPP